MAVPKKKVSRSRRNMRRYSANKRPTAVATTTCKLTGALTRTHTVSSKEAYNEAYAKNHGASAK